MQDLFTSTLRADEQISIIQPNNLNNLGVIKIALIFIVIWKQSTNYESVFCFLRNATVSTVYLFLKWCRSMLAFFFPLLINKNWPNWNYNCFILLIYCDKVYLTLWNLISSYVERPAWKHLQKPPSKVLLRRESSGAPTYMNWTYFCGFKKNKWIMGQKTKKKLRKSPFGYGAELGKKRDCKQNAVRDNFSLTKWRHPRPPTSKQNNKCCL